MREHAFLLPTEEPFYQYDKDTNSKTRGFANGPWTRRLRHHHAGTLFRVPAGFAGQGEMQALGAGGARGRWVADLSRGNLILNAELPRVLVGGLSLTRNSATVGGPVLKVVASVLDREIQVFLQGSLGFRL